MSLPWKLSLEIAAGAGGLFAFGILVYALGSFVGMRPHTTARALGVSLRELLRETFLVAVTQPFLPLFYVVGRRMEPFLVRRAERALASDGLLVPVVFVHGYMQNRVDFLVLARALGRRGLGPLYGINYPWFASIGSNAKRLERFIADVCAETGSPAVDLVCHSMGGLVAMEMMGMTARREDLKVRRCVTIATPHAGVAWRGPLIGIGATSLRRGSKLLEAHAGYKLVVPTLSIFSSHDNIVHPKETARLAPRGGRDVEVDGLSHLAILFSSAVSDRVASFLTEPEPSEGIVAAASGEASEREAPSARDEAEEHDDRAGDGDVERGERAGCAPRSDHAL